MSQQTHTRSLIGAALLGLLTLGPGAALAEDKTPPPGPPPAAEPDNTAHNKRDRLAGEPTADDQKNARPDREIAAEIRRAVVKDKSLSTSAHNVKIIVQGGTVTLKGPVLSEAESASIEGKAAQVAGPDKVQNRLEIAPKK